jgi:dTDP-4-dehydrorhamnose reductase
MEKGAVKVKDRPSILITGARGMLGRDLMKVFSNGFRLLGIDIQDADITDLWKIDKIFRRFRPDTVIHTAAFTDVDGCEKKPDKAFLVNALGTRNIALACRRTRSRLVYLSTDYVFPGTKGAPYTEFDPPGPINVYGRSKLAGERYVATLLSRFFIVRTSWLFGHHGKNFVDTMIRVLRSEGAAKVVNDQWGAPTFAVDLAGKILEIVEDGSYGTYHVTNGGICSWYELARKIADLGGFRGVKISPLTSGEISRAAQRPRYSVLDNMVLRLDGFAPIRPWEEGLKAFLVQRNEYLTEARHDDR